MILYYLMMLPVFACVSLAVYLPCTAVEKTFGREPLIWHLPRFAFCGCCVSLVFLTLVIGGINFSPAVRHLNLQPFVWVNSIYVMGTEKMLEQLVLNVVMFIPFGFLLPFQGKTKRSFFVNAAIVVCTTVCIEVIQYFIGRSCDIDDVIMNFLGGICGLGLFFFAEKLFCKQEWWRRMRMGV